MRIARRTLIAIAATVLSLPCPASANTVSLADQQVVMEHFRPMFVYPQFSRWRFDSAAPYWLGGTLVCGHVNFENSNRTFEGERAFYMVIRDGSYLEGGIVGNMVEDPAGTIRFAYHLLCEKH
jgi:hypothetical protein